MPRGVACLWALGLLTLTGCAPEGLAFQADERVQIVQPQDQSTVRLPVTVDWTVEDFDVIEPGAQAAADVGPGSGSFAVFLDRAPQPPGEPLRWLARDDSSCRESEGCPDADYLAAQGVYATTDTRMVFEQFVVPPATSKRAERHSVTVVLLDAAGARIGESAFQVDFTVDRGVSS